MRKSSQMKKTTSDAAKDTQPLATLNPLANLKSVKMSEDETKFIIEYRRLEELEREKGIKFFQCVGDEPHTE